MFYAIICGFLLESYHLPASNLDLCPRLCGSSRTPRRPSVLRSIRGTFEHSNVRCVVHILSVPQTVWRLRNFTVDSSGALWQPSRRSAQQSLLASPLTNLNHPNHADADYPRRMMIHFERSIRPRATSRFHLSQNRGVVNIFQPTIHEIINQIKNLPDSTVRTPELDRIH